MKTTEKNKIKTPKSIAKKKTIIFGVVFGAIGIILLIAGAILVASASNVAADVCFVIGAFALFIGIFSSYYDLKKIKRTYCAKCGAKLDYEDDVSWELDDITTDGNARTGTYDVHTRCHVCGNESDFTIKQTLASIDKDGNVHQKNGDAQLKKYFK